MKNQLSHSPPTGWMGLDMRTKIINGIEVIECIHCNGTGICKHSREREVGDDRFSDKVVQECDSCGTGLVGNTGFFRGSKATPPTCKICDGKGFYRV